MKFILFVLLLAGCLFSPTANAEFQDWTEENQKLYISAITIHAIDALQTFAMIECQRTNPYCPYIEKNPFLGERPSKGRVVISMGIAQYVYFKMLDSEKITPRKRRNLLIANNVLAVYPVITNEQIGLGIYIPILPYRNFINK